MDYGIHKHAVTDTPLGRLRGPMTMNRSFLIAVPVGKEGKWIMGVLSYKSSHVVGNSPSLT